VVRSLAVGGGRIVVAPELLEEVLERDPGRVKGDQYRLGVSGRARADLLIGRIVDPSQKQPAANAARSSPSGISSGWTGGACVASRGVLRPNIVCPPEVCSWRFPWHSGVQPARLPLLSSGLRTALRVIRGDGQLAPRKPVDSCEAMAFGSVITHSTVSMTISTSPRTMRPIRRSATHGSTTR
jgi:hypothetical protein